MLVNYSKKNLQKIGELNLGENDTFHSEKNDWHQIYNPYNDECKIIEIQYGQRNY